MGSPDLNTFFLGGGIFKKKIDVTYCISLVVLEI